MQLSGLLHLLLAESVIAQGDLLSLLRSQPELSTLTSLVELTGLNETLSTLTNITILAPTNDAFARVNPDDPEGMAITNRNATSVEALLANHVFNGSYPAGAITEVPTFAQTLVTPEYQNDVQPFTDITGGQYNGLVKNGENVQILSGEFAVSTVVQADIRLGEGIIIHVIDRTLQFGPPLQLYTARADLKTFNSLFAQYGPELSLGLTGPSGSEEASRDLTVFVPVNEAFSLVGSEINVADNDTLRAVLSYHVIANNIIFSPSLGNTSVQSLEGTDLTVTLSANGSSAFVNGAKIVLPNIILSNGVCHLIDSVLNPGTPLERATFDFEAPASARIAFPDATPASVPVPSASFAGLDAVETADTSIPAIFTTGYINAVATSAEATATGAASPSAYSGLAAKLNHGAEIGAAGVVMAGILAML